MSLNNCFYYHFLIIVFITIFSNCRGLVSSLLIESLLISTNDTEQFADVLHKRHERLIQIAKVMKRRYECNINKIITMNEIPYGDTSNKLLSFVNLLVVAEFIEGIAMYPHWMNDVLHHIDLGLLKQQFCITPHKAGYQQFGKLTSYDAFNGYRLFLLKKYNQVLPPWTSSLIPDISKIYIKIYSCLFANTPTYIKDFALKFINEKLSSNLNYTAVHKRSMEGRCDGLLFTNSNTNDFNSTEIPLDLPEWNNSTGFHPICNMSVNFIQKTKLMNNIHNQNLFIAYDGRGDLTEYRKINGVISSDLNSNDNIERKYIDIYIAIHSEFAILNPVSTYSFSIFIIRTILGLKTVPNPKPNKDLFFNSVEEYATVRENRTWVSYASIVDAMNGIQKQYNISII